MATEPEYLPIGTPPEPPFLRIDKHYPMPKGTTRLVVLRGLLKDGETQEARWHRRNAIVRAQIARMEREGRA